jgi:hypothetical protein
MRNPSAVDSINDHDERINGKLKSALNKFFKRYPNTIEGCILRKNWDGADYALIIESSDLYYHLQGVYGWTVHTDFYNSFGSTGFHPEMQNSCTVGFYKD